MRTTAAALTALALIVLVAVPLTAAPALATEDQVAGIQSANAFQGVVLAFILGVVVGVLAYVSSRRQAGGRTTAQGHAETGEGTA